MRVVIGVDAGGTSTRAVVSRDGVASAPVSGERANPSSRGILAAVAAIADTIDRALAGTRADVIIVGASGAGRAESAGALREALAGCYPTAAVTVTHDAEIALRAGIPSGDGIVLVAGTGSSAYAEIDGQSTLSGGHGFAIDDGGSGYAIGSAGARLLGRAYDGRLPHDATCDALARQLGVSNARALAEKIYGEGTPVAAVAALASTIIALADAGERSAMKIIQGAALELGDLVRTVAKASGAGDRDVPIVLAGGLLKTNSLLTFLLETRIGAEMPTMHVLKGVPEPCFGALVLGTP